MKKKNKGKNVVSIFDRQRFKRQIYNRLFYRKKKKINYFV